MLFRQPVFRTAYELAFEKGTTRVSARDFVLGRRRRRRHENLHLGNDDGRETMTSDDDATTTVPMDTAALETPTEASANDETTTVVDECQTMRNDARDTICDNAVVLSSPLRNQIAGVQSLSSVPYFKELSIDPQTKIEYILYTQVEEKTVTIEAKKVLEVIKVGTKKAEWLDTAQSKADIAREWCRGIIPAHIPIKGGRQFAWNFLYGAKRAGNPRSSVLSLGVITYCSAKVDGCPTQIHIGFREEALLSFNEDPPPETVDVTMVFVESCQHIKNKGIGQLRGKARQRTLEEYNKANKAPSEYLKDQVGMASTAEFHLYSTSLWY